MTPPKTILHVGPGHRSNGARVPPAFQTSEWREVRLDIDPANEPDIIGSMLDMAAVPDASVDALYSAHNIEHVHAHEVPAALAEFRISARAEAGWLCHHLPGPANGRRAGGGRQACRTCLHHTSPAGSIAPGLPTPDVALADERLSLKNA